MKNNLPIAPKARGLLPQCVFPTRAIGVPKQKNRLQPEHALSPED